MDAKYYQVVVDETSTVLYYVQNSTASDGNVKGSPLAIVKWQTHEAWLQYEISYHLWYCIFLVPHGFSC